MNAITPKHEPEASLKMPTDVANEVVVSATLPKRPAQHDAGESLTSTRPEEASEASSASSTRSRKPKPGTYPNNVRKLRQAAMMSKAELARRAGVSPLTINRVEAGCPCRMDTKRKILEALGLDPSAREDVFGPDVDEPA